MLDADLGYFEKLVLGVNHAGGIGGIVEHKAFGFIRDCRFKLRRAYLEALLLTCKYDDGGRAHHFDHFVIAEPVGCRDDYLIAGVNYGAESCVQTMLCTACDDNLRVIIVKSAISFKLCRDRPAQRHDACGGGIFCFALTDGGYAGKTDVIGGLEVGFARSEAYNIKPVGLHLLCKTVNCQC